MAIPLKSPAQIEGIRAAGALLWTILTRAVDEAKPGNTARQLDAFITQAIAEAGAQAVMRGYRGQHGDAPPFEGAASICINEEVVHAVPGPRIIRDGDLVTIDVALSHRGWFADAAVTLVVGNRSEDPRRGQLRKAATEVLQSAVAAAGPGRRWSDVAAAAWEAARREGVWLLGDFAGHGIGRELHEPPTVAFDPPEQPAAAARLDFVLRPGMVFTIEPVLVPGRTSVLGLDDGWTIVTENRSPAAHEERTVAITRNGAAVLTA